MGKGRIQKQKQPESEDWCFICKDGGHLQLCEYRQCQKAYHSRCLKKKKLSVPSSEMSWHCSRHTCSKCDDPSTFFCYCCPTALCHKCVDAVHFFPTEKKNGFCHECRRQAIFVENEKGKLKSKVDRLFKEYYDIIKEEEGFSLKNLQSPEERSEIKNEQKSHGRYIIGGLEKDEGIIDFKRFKEQSNRKLNVREKSDNEDVVRKTPEVLFASIVPGNIKLVYLRRSLIQELLKEPESFESKVKGCYVRVKSGSIVSRERRSYQLMQVTDVNKASSGQDTDIKLQLLDMPNAIGINLLSDENFSVEECEVLRQKMEVGLLKKPTLDELDEKARSLHKDMIDHNLAREMRALEGKIGYANEKGRKFMLYQFLEERKVLETPSYRLRLLSTPPKVIPELQEPSNQLKGYISTCEGAEQEEQEVVMVTGPMEDRKQNEECGSLSEELIGGKCSLPLISSEQHSLHGASSPIDPAADCAVQPTSGSCENTSFISRKEGEPSSLGEGKKQNETPETSIGNVDLDALIDQLIKPNVSCSSAGSGSSEALKNIKEGFILLLNQVPVSDFKSMVAVSNGAFTCLHGLSINYNSFYECVKNYIGCCYLLASTEQFKQAPSMEELAAIYDLGKEYSEMMKENSSKISEGMTSVLGQISDAEKSWVKFETERLACGIEHQSGSWREVLDMLKRSQDDVRNNLYALAKSKKLCHFEERWEAFVNAKAALGL